MCSPGFLHPRREALGVSDRERLVETRNLQVSRRGKLVSICVDGLLQVFLIGIDI